LFEIKGERLAKLTEDLPDAMAYKFTDQATRQLAASGGRAVVWIFAEEGAALFARKLFDDESLKGITVGYDMTLINHRYFVRGHWVGPADEVPADIGAKFLQTLDALSDIDALFRAWQFTGPWQIPEEHRSSFVPLATARGRITEIVEAGVYTDDFNKPCPEYGHNVIATAGARGPQRVAFAASTNRQSFDLRFGEHNLASDLSIVKYSLFKAALLAISAAWDAQWACAQAFRNDVVKVPIDFGPGVPAFRIDSAPQVPLDPTFPNSIFHVPWIVYLSAQHAAGLNLTPEILIERTSNGGVLMSATSDRLDPTNPEHVRRARILAETMITRTGS
jgi:hypothetical protein